MIGRTHSEGRRFGTRRAADPQHTPGRRRSKALASVAMLTSFAALLGNASAGVNTAAAILPKVVNPVLASSTQFDITGFAQTATWACQGTPAPAPAHCGGSVTINNHVIVIPDETIAILPASALSWQELFAKAPLPYGLAGNGQSGLALNDSPRPLTTYEFHVVGNRIINGAGDRYIAGLVHVSQSELNGAQGYINYMDYLNGDMYIGGAMGTQTGARVRIADVAASDPAGTPILFGPLPGAPTGRYGRISTGADLRFQVDQDNPTIASSSGYPMCFPRVTSDPTVLGATDDPLCPQVNRPVLADGTFSQLFTTQDPTLPLDPLLPDPHKQAPFEVGDYASYSGTLTADAVGQFISAHTVIDSNSIRTVPNTNPAYVTIEVSLIGTGGLTVFGAGEAAIRTRFEGMSTDITRPIYLYGVDLKADGTLAGDRYWGTIGPDPGPPGGAVPGRWRFRPPCLQFGNIPPKPDRGCVFGPDNGFLPPTREVRAVIAAVGSDVGQNPLGPPPVPSNPNPATNFTANGISWGQYHAPIGEYIFPEATPGHPIVENNFNNLPFLALGGYSSNTGLIAGQLNPWPSNVLPTLGCIAAVPNIGAVPVSVPSGALIPLAATSTGVAPITYSWTATTGTFSDPTISSPTWTAPTLLPGGLATSVTLSLTVSNTCTPLGSTPVTATVLVNPPPAVIRPTVNQPAPQSVITPNDAVFTVSGTDPNSTGALTFTAIPTAAPTTATVLQLTPLTAQVTVHNTVPGVYQVSIVASDVGSNISLPVFASVTVKAIVGSDNPVVLTALYRQLKQRLVLTANDTSAPTAALMVQPYLRKSDCTMFDPLRVGTNIMVNNAGAYTYTLVGASQPALVGECPLQPSSAYGIKLVSSLGATSPTFTAIAIRAN